MTGERRPVAVVLAGPNGAGKSTASTWLVPAECVFLNADVVAARLRAEGHPVAGLDIAAGRLVLAEMRHLVDIREPFCVETNLAGRSLAGTISSWRTVGYVVRLHFIALRSPELALARVAERVAAGGHDVPEEVVRRRWRAGLQALFDLYIPLVDKWSLIDNSELATATVARGEPGKVEVVDPVRWAEFRRLGQSDL
ncbi:MAG: AAA family ATPase [Acidimicrobiales bacterium]